MPRRAPRPRRSARLCDTFHVNRQVDGMVTDSHGCVRVSNEAIDCIWADDLAPTGTTVWVH